MIPRVHQPLLVAVLMAGMFFGAPVPAAAEDDPDVSELRERLKEIDSSFEADSIRATEVENLYEVVSGTRVFYVTGDGRFMLRGQLVDLESSRNLTSIRKRELMQARIESVGEDNMLVYEPKVGPARHSITVFTDTTCPYCRQLHLGLMDIIEQYPVRVRYLLFPRAGLQAPAADTMRDVWCAADPQAAMTAAKTGGEVAERAEGCETPVAEHYRLGREIGISGTPFMLVDDEVVPGYRPNKVLLQMMGLAAQSEG